MKNAVFNTQFLVLNTQFLVFNTQFLVLNTQFLVFNTNFVVFKKMIKIVKTFKTGIHSKQNQHIKRTREFPFNKNGRPFNVKLIRSVLRRKGRINLILNVVKFCECCENDSFTK